MQSNEAFITTSDPTASTTGQADSGTDLNSGDAVVLPQTLLPPHSTQAGRSLEKEIAEMVSVASLLAVRSALNESCLNTHAYLCSNNY